MKDAPRNRLLALLVLLSFLAFAAGFVVRIGIEATPYDTTDRAGRPTGFNDPLGTGHFLIILQNFQPAELLKPQRAYEWLLLAMQATGAWLLLSRAHVSAQLARWFFAVQPVLFPLGVLLCYAPPLILLSPFTMTMDREGFTDVPFVMSMGLTAHSFWVVSSLIIVFALRGPGLGVSQVWHALVKATRIGGRTFVNALR